jgi:RNA-directed DNA polymerase
VSRICEAISEMTGRDHTLLDRERVVARVNGTMIGWANYFCLGPVNKADQAVERHACKRLRQWLCTKGYGRDQEVSGDLHARSAGLVYLTKRARNSPWAIS